MEEDMDLLSREWRAEGRVDDDSKEWNLSI